jgi:hypothetical protein
MKVDDRIDSDLKALAAESQLGLPTMDRTMRALGRARADREERGDFMSMIRRKPVVATALGIAALGIGLVIPVPYTRTVGYELHVKGADGRSAVLQLPMVSAAQVERRARALRERGAEVNVAPRSERVWGPVYAMASEKLFNVDVATDGKTDAEVEAEIGRQLELTGWHPSTVSFRREKGQSTTEVGADDGAGRRIRVVRKTPDGEPVEIRAGDIDDKREPGMTDEQLRQKILGQLKARGMDADVTVQGNRIEIRAHHGGGSPSR